MNAITFPIFVFSNLNLGSNFVLILLHLQKTKAFKKGQELRVREQDPQCHLSYTWYWTPPLGPSHGRESTWAQSLSVKARPFGTRNPCPKTENRWEAVKHFSLQRFPQNKTSWVFPIVVALSFLRAFAISQKILQKWSQSCLISLIYCIELLYLSCFFYLAGIFLIEVCWGRLFHCGFFSWISEMELSNTIRYYS